MNVKNKTPEPQRLHIVITGAANSGKSSLLNALTGQHTSVVSSTKGTTTDPVKKPMELHGTGPVIFVDTAGFGDSTELGALRTEKTLEAIRSADMIICVFSADTFYNETAGDTGSPTALSWLKLVNESGKKIIPVLSKCDLMTGSERTEYVQKNHTDGEYKSCLFQCFSKYRELCIRAFGKNSRVHSSGIPFAKNFYRKSLHGK